MNCQDCEKELDFYEKGDDLGDYRDAKFCFECSDKYCKRCSSSVKLDEFWNSCETGCGQKYCLDCVPNSCDYCSKLSCFLCGGSIIEVDDGADICLMCIYMGEEAEIYYVDGEVLEHPESKNDAQKIRKFILNDRDLQYRFKPSLNKEILFLYENGWPRDPSLY